MRTIAAALFMGVLACGLGAAPARADDARPATPGDAKSAPGGAKPVPGGAGLGVTLGPLPEALRAHLGLGIDKGLMVAEVRRDGPAERAGIRKFDVLVELDGQPLDSPAALAALLAARRPGATAKLKTITAARFADVEVALGPPDAPGALAAGAAPPLRRGRLEPGLEPQDAEPDFNARLKELRARQRQLLEGMAGLPGAGFDGPVVRGGGIAIGGLGGFGPGMDFVINAPGMTSMNSRFSTADDDGQFQVAVSRRNDVAEISVKGLDAAGAKVEFTAQGQLADVVKKLHDAADVPAALKQRIQRSLGVAKTPPAPKPPAQGAGKAPAKAPARDEDF
jgi:membrane-associated protease RseP (regulator of RpoE activity)